MFLQIFVSNVTYSNKEDFFVQLAEKVIIYGLYLGYEICIVAGAYIVITIFLIGWR